MKIYMPSLTHRSGLTIKGINSEEQQAGNLNTNDHVVVVPAQQHMQTHEKQFDDEYEVFEMLYLKHKKAMRKELEGDADFNEDLDTDDEEDAEVEAYDQEGRLNISNNINVFLCLNAIFLVLMICCDVLCKLRCVPPISSLQFDL